MTGGKGGQLPPRPTSKGASASGVRAPMPGPSTATIPPITTNQPSTRPFPPTSPLKTQTYRVQLKKIDANVTVNREDIFRTAFQTINAPLIRLTDTRTGFYAVTDDQTAVDKLTSQKATDSFKTINLTPITPPDLRAKRTIFVRQIDRYAGSHTPDEIKREIQTLNRDIKIDTVIKIKDYTHIIKIIAHDSQTAQFILTHGFNMFHTRITPHQCEQEKYVHLLICFRCYKYEDHPTHLCKSTSTICSECAQTDHTYHDCKTERKECINCGQNHRTLAASCPVRRTAIRDREDKDKKRRDENDNKTYAKVAQETIDRTHAAPRHQINLTDKTHIKLTALILEAHIASLTGRPFGQTLSDSLKLNYDIDAKFPDRDSQAIFNMYIGDKTATATTDPIEILPPTSDSSDTESDVTAEDAMETETTQQKRKASESPQQTRQPTTTGVDIRLFRNESDKTPIPKTLTNQYVIDELDKIGSFGLKLHVKDYSAQQVYKEIVDGRLKVTNAHIRTLPHDRFMQLSRMSSSKEVRKPKMPKQQ